MLHFPHNNEAAVDIYKFHSLVQKCRPTIRDITQNLRL